MRRRRPLARQEGGEGLDGRRDPLSGVLRRAVGQDDRVVLVGQPAGDVLGAETEAEEDAEGGGEVAVREESAVVETAKEAAYDRTDDPVRMYLREMGSVELLSREGEIAIAKRIEAGRDTMIRGLCESALTFEAIMVWREELGSGRILLREVIDLEQTYGGQNAGAEALPVEAVADAEDEMEEAEAVEAGIGIDPVPLTRMFANNVEPNHAFLLISNKQICLSR